MLPPPPLPVTIWIVNHSREVYEICQPGYRGRCTAPLVVDRLARRLVSNESSDIVRNLNSVQLLGASDVDLVPAALEREIDQLNDLVYNQASHCLGETATGVKLQSSQSAISCLLIQKATL
jgi:glutathionyl-hydroquinone reductase